MMSKMIKMVFMVVLMLACSFSVAQAADFNWSPLNVEGDTVYMLETGAFGVGVGTNIATYKDVVEFRGMLVSSVDKVDVNKVGFGIGVDVPNVIKKLGGAWLLDNVNATLGITGLTNVNGEMNIEPAIYVSVIGYSR